MSLAVLKNSHKTLTSKAKLQSFSWTIFLNKLKYIKQSVINDRFPNYIVVREINISLIKLDNIT